MTGKLIERAPEYVYRKIVRETAALRKITYPAVRVPPPIRKTHDMWWSWVETVKGINRWDFLKLSEEEQRKLRDEWVRWMRGKLD